MTKYPAGPAGAFAERLNYSMDLRKFPKRGRQAHWKKKFGVSGPTARAWVVGEHMPEDWRVRAMANELDVDFEWLMFGSSRSLPSSSQSSEGALHESFGLLEDVMQLPTDQKAMVSEPSTYSRPMLSRRQKDDLRPIRVWNDDDEIAETYVTLPRMESRLAAGFPGPASEVEALTSGAAFRADYVKRKGWSPSTHLTLRASGQSMEPTIQDGAPVVIAMNETVIKSGRIYALRLNLDEEPILKRIDRLPGGKIRIRSDNPDPRYFAFEAFENEVEIIGRAVWTPTEL